jgi:hypothetical protein
VHEAAASIPTEACARFSTAEKLSDEDRKTVIEIARKALACFQPTPEAKPEAKAEPKPEAKPKLDDRSKPDAPTDAEPKAKPETEPKPKAALKEKL